MHLNLGGFLEKEMEMEQEQEQEEGKEGRNRISFLFEDTNDYCQLP